MPIRNVGELRRWLNENEVDDGAAVVLRLFIEKTDTTDLFDAAIRFGVDQGRTIVVIEEDGARL